jgi:predicted HTH domain antitoxin
MPLVLPDEALAALGMNEPEARVEIACRLFDAGKIAFGHAAALAGLTETEFDDALVHRGLPRYRYTPTDLESDLKALGGFEKGK